MRAAEASHARGVLLFALALPLSVGLALLAPPAVSLAQGCTGGSAEGWANLPTGWHSVTADTTAGATLPSDAVFVLRGQLRGLDESAALAAASVQVKDAGGASVPGTLALIDRLEVEVGLADLRRAALVWRPAAPLTPAVKYEVWWTVGGQSSSTELVVAAASEAPAPAEIDTLEHAEVMALSGPYVQCGVPANCGGGTIQLTFHSSTTRQKGIHVVVSPGTAAANASYQQFELGAVPGKGTLVGLPRRALAISSAAAVANKVALSAAFGESLAEYCVRLVTTDLRNGSTTESEPLCVTSSSTPVDAASWWESAISSCLEPPPPELEDIWCKHHPSALTCGGSGEGGTSGSGGSSAKPDTESSGCACAAPVPTARGALWLGALWLGALALGVRRRQQGRFLVGPSVDDVEVEGHDGHSLRDRGAHPDDHELDARSGQPDQQRQCVVSE